MGFANFISNFDIVVVVVVAPVDVAATAAVIVVVVVVNTISGDFYVSFQIVNNFCLDFYFFVNIFRLLLLLVCYVFFNCY